MPFVLVVTVQPRRPARTVHVRLCSPQPGRGAGRASRLSPAGRRTSGSGFGPCEEYNGGLGGHDHMSAHSALPPRPLARRPKPWAASRGGSTLA